MIFSHIWVEFSGLRPLTANAVYTQTIVCLSWGYLLWALPTPRMKLRFLTSYRVQLWTSSMDCLWQYSAQNYRFAFLGFTFRGVPLHTTQGTMSLDPCLLALRIESRNTRWVCLELFPKIFVGGCDDCLRGHLTALFCVVRACFHCRCYVADFARQHNHALAAHTARYA